MIYFIEAVGVGLLKIGFTDRDPEQRLRELQTGCPHKLRLCSVWNGPHGTQAMERVLHEDYDHLRESGEWFRMDDELRWFVWWLKHGRPEVESMVNGVDGGTEMVRLDLKKAEERVAVLEERNEYIEDQIYRLRKTIGEMNGWPDGVQSPGDTIAVIPRAVGIREYADCRM